jgi:succinoglycan biosynthesis transport protein ExoP
MKFSMDTRRQSYDLIKNWLDGELQLLASKVEDSERKLYEHGQKKNFLSLEEKDNTIVGKYVELNILLTRAQAERMAKEAQYREIKERGSNAPLITHNALIQKLREEIITQEARTSSLKKIYGQKYPQVQVEQGKLKELKARLNEEVKRMRDTIQADYRTAQRTENLLKETLDGQKARVGELQANLVKHHILKRDMQTNEQLY